MSNVFAGQVFTWLTVVGPASPSRWGRPRSECICRCGKTVIVRNSDLTRRDKSTKSCRCYNIACTRQRNHENRETKHVRFRDLTGVKQHDGRLTAIRCIGFAKLRHARWECRCDCKNVVIVLRGAFLNETTRSCGCLKRKSDSHRFGSDNPNFKDGRFCFGMVTHATMETEAKTSSVL
jgi:hypothetical protein